MRSYRQYCALAKALDVIGDRWNLLIVRELLLGGASRYTDLLRGLPGIATNLLADRLVALERSGVVQREMARPPIATTLYSLTRRGESLRGVVEALGHWGAPLLADQGDDAFLVHWLALPAADLLRDHAPDEPPVTIAIGPTDGALVIEAEAGEVRTRAVRIKQPDAEMTGPPDVLVALLAGRIDLPTARKRGLAYGGDPRVLARVQPASVPGAAARSARSGPR